MSKLLLTQELKKLKKFDQEVDWFQKNYERLRSKYKGEYVIVRGSNIVDHDKDAVVLLKRAKEKYGDTSSLVVEYVSEKKTEFVL